MDWIQFAIFLITTGGLFLWSRSESRSDYRELREDMKQFQEAMKDFHGRLCTIEERYLKFLTERK